MVVIAFPQAFRFFEIMAEEAVFPNLACRAAIIGLPNIHEYNRIPTNITEHSRI